MMIQRKKSLTEIIKEIEKRYGTYVYKRFDVYYSVAKKKRLLGRLKKRPFGRILGMEVVGVKDFDGFKFMRKDGSWLMLRPSGTEPKLRIYSEGHSDKEALRLIEFGKKFALSI